MSDRCTAVGGGVADNAEAAYWRVQPHSSPTEDIDTHVITYRRSEVVTLVVHDTCGEARSFQQVWPTAV